MSAIISQKALYAVRAALELARHRRSEGPLRMRDIAKAQDIPARFLESILNQLRRAGLAESVRGPDGGYLLARPAAAISVGEVIHAVQGPLRAVGATSGRKRVGKGAEVLAALWIKAGDALSTVFYETSLQKLIQEEAEAGGGVLYEI